MEHATIFIKILIGKLYLYAIHYLLSKLFFLIVAYKNRLEVMKKCETLTPWNYWQSLRIWSIIET